MHHHARQTRASSRSGCKQRSAHPNHQRSASYTKRKIRLGVVASRRIFWGQGLIEIGEFTNDLNQPWPAAMSHSAEALYKMSEVDLLAAYAHARREFVEKKFARDTQRARLA
jgi:hypothetical protein